MISMDVMTSLNRHMPNHGALRLPFARATLSTLILLTCATLASTSHAMEAMSEDSMSNATGEGLAFFANNFQFQMPSVAGDVSQSSATPALGTFGAGSAATTNPGAYGSYVYLGPLGSVPAPFTNNGTTFTPNRTDLYIYGLSLSENNITNVTTSAGSACTPTTFNSSGQATNTPTGCIGVGSVAAPADALHGTVAHNTLFNGTASGGITWGSATNPFTLAVSTTPVSPGLGGENSTIPYLQIAAPTSALPASDPSNNLRLGLWTNILQEDMTSTATQQAGGNNSLTPTGTAGPALQIQAIWDGFGINGTVINAFPTDPCTSAACGGTNPGNANYANTLGLAGVLRFNSQATGVLRLSVGGTGTTNASYGQFDAYEGIYLQQLNVNLPLGNINYQPLILSSGATVVSGNSYISPTLSLELAQIPNTSSVYNQFYINYDPSCSVSGSTCTTPSSGSTYGNAANSVGLSPAAGMCSSGFGTTTACPSTATHGNISVGNVYVNNTSSIMYTYIDGSGNPQAVSCAYPCTSVPAGAAAATKGYDVVYPGEADANYITTGTGTTGFAQASTSNTTGTVFKAPGATGAAINLGNAAISGLMINHMKMTLTGL